LPPQVAPQKPQFVLFVPRSAQVAPRPAPQPVDGGTHEMTQAPSEQRGADAGQALAQAPQLALFELRITQLPSPPRPPSAHWVSPAGQSHVPFTHPPPKGQVVPQAPQLAGFVRRSTQTVAAPPLPPGHAVNPPLPQPATQVPPEQLVPPRHTRPQAPQLLLSAEGSTQVAPHRIWPAAQLHAPPEQLAPLGHWVAQAPQCAGFPCRSMHAPLQLVSAIPASLVPQAALQTPPLQTGVPPIAVHTAPQAPQLAGSLCVWKQTPLQRIPAKHWQVPL
jgi:hypothetical protein